MTAQDVLLEDRSDGVLVLTMHRPDARNALNRPLRDALIDAFERIAKDDATDVVILTGTPPAFCAGLDLKELGQASDGGESAASERDLITAVHGCDRPVIGAINGVAVTGGFELALACDVLVASEEARFADTHARVGIMPGWGLSQKLPRLIGLYRAKHLSLTGNYLAADRAADWGLVSEVVPADRLLDTCHALAQDMRSCERDAVRAYKSVLDDGFALPFGEAMALESERSRAWMQDVRSSDIADRRTAIQQRGRNQTR